MPCRGCGKNSGRAVGEIGEALPVADEASRFRGSAPIGGHDSDRESVGTTVGNRRPLRKRNKRCNGRATARVAPTDGLQGVRYRDVSPSHGFAVPAPFRQGAKGTGDADCHSRFANWPRNDRFLQEVRWAGRCGERAERCRWQRKRSERVAAVKILSVRRKAAQKFWAPQQGHRPLRKVT